MFDYKAPKYQADKIENFAKICHIRDDTIKPFAPKVRALLAGDVWSTQTNIDARVGATKPVRSDLAGQQPTTELNVSRHLIPLDAGRFSLSVIPSQILDYIATFQMALGIHRESFQRLRRTGRGKLGSGEAEKIRRRSA
jgi:hypothetical protein